MRQNTARVNKFKKPLGERKRSVFNFSLAKEAKLRLTLGFFLISLSIYLFVAFISYLFSGKTDQSIVNTWHEIGILESGKEVSNWLGLYGAILAHYFIFKWFGVSAFFIPLLLFLWSWYLLFDIRLLSLSSSLSFSLFWGFWLSLLLGYITYNTSGEGELGFFTGGMGYEMARLFNSLLGWGTVLVLIFTLFIFAIHFFNITKLHWTNNDQIESSEQVASSTEAGDNVAHREAPPSESGADIITKDSDEANTPDNIESGTQTEEAKDISLTVETNKQEVANDTPQPTFVVEPSKTESTAEKLVTEQGNYDPTLDLSKFKLPPLDLLDDYNTEEVQVSQDELNQNKDKIVDTLTNFKIGITSIKATIGPTVTLYEIVPEAGVKISRIKNLEDDIALSLAAFGIRIIAPIPGKGTIGIEVPNKNREMVRIKQALSARSFTQSEKELPVALGKTISNETLVVDLAKMPHLLVAGATGQGKSVGLNVILTSLLYKRHPSQLKFILVDPKKVEMSLFAHIERHYLAKMPNSEEAIITDTRKVVHTLNSLCIEMENRYEMMKAAGTRNLKEYNTKFVNRLLNPNEGHRFLPYIVLVIDELADLMMTAGKEVETPIARLAQLARAIGIHLVVATQRPSVNVITGVIKANFPARLSFRVTSKVDSRTILDSSGADQLIGHGDMLLSSGSDIVRLQCPFVDTHEVEKVCSFISAQQGYESAYLLPEFEGDDEGGTSSVDLSDRDAFFEDAAKLVVAHQQGSASLIQRKLKLGYNRAGRIIDQLEAAGIVGAFEGSKAREVLVGSEDGLEQIFNDLKEKQSSS